ncbi:GspE/PulE/PilB domain-containing protein [Hyalangium versicolor]|uniref:GspE/PulE/PilB domain-containing protein n=1 Tax=Hyalangium versicolor TaxID=2861190 RepID=UPI001CD00FCB|nr:general secretion pathway protein GspE [Hyalangium versicolor]
MRKKIGELLVEAGYATDAQVRTALGQKRSYGRGHRLGSVMVSMGMITPKQLARVLATQFDLPFVELPDIPHDVATLLAIDFQSEHRIVPFKLEQEGKNERLHVAVEDPGDLSLLDELRFQLRKTLRVYVAASDDIDNALIQARGEKLDIVQAVAVDEEHGDGGMKIERGSPVVQGNWVTHDEDTPPIPRPRPPLLTPSPATPPPPPKEAANDFIDDLLGTKKRPAQPPPSPQQKPPPPPPEAAESPDQPKVPVIMFGGAAKNVKPPERNLPPNFSEEDLAVLDDLERLSQGEEPAAPTQKIMPAQMVAALVRLLIKKRVIQEEEFLDELSRK